jgi:thiol:disulfide interchange protein/DsbC/DsbD-like thiol-disulfide interchange protein
MTSPSRKTTLFLAAFAPSLMLVDIGASATSRAFEEFPHSRARLIAEHQTLSPEGTTLALHVTLDPEWHSYWEHPGDSGAAPIFNFKAPDGVDIGPAIYTVPERIETPPLTTFGYTEKMVVRFPVSVRGRVGGKITLDAEWLVCRVECIPALGTFSIDLPWAEQASLSEDAAMIAEARRGTPDSSAVVVTSAVIHTDGRVVLTTAPGLVVDDVFPRQGSIFGTKKPRVEANTITLTQSHEALPDAHASGLLLTRRSDGTPAASQFDVVPSHAPTNSVTPSEPFSLKLIFLAFLGGVILNLMPCVFPVISIKLLSIAKYAHGDTGILRRDCVAYTLGVLTCFFGFAVILTALRAGGAGLGWGFQLQSPVFVLALALLFFTLAANFLGWFEIHIPVGHRMNTLMQKSGPVGQFMTGALSTIVASPCTAPFMGAAMGVAISQSTPALFAAFMTVGLGLASPYLLFAVNPKMLRVFPKPGPWMDHLKQFMAFPLFLTSVWLLWLLGQLSGNHSVAWALSACVIIGLAIWLNRKFQHGFIALLLAVGAPISLMGFLAFRAEAPVPSSSGTEMNWIPWSEQVVATQHAAGKTVFINFTADWCITCKVNEFTTFRDAGLAEFVRKNEIVMLKADWTKRDSAITKVLADHERIGVPTYLLWEPGKPRGHVLPEVLTPGLFVSQVTEIRAY